MSGVQFADDLLGLDAGVLGEHPGDDLERFRELVDAVLLQAGVCLCPLRHLSGEINLRGAASRSQMTVLTQP